KIILLSLTAVAMLGFSVKILPEIIQQVAFILPYFVDLSQPADFSLNHTVNMYVSSEEGISLGVWLTVPESQWKEAQGKDLNWYQESLGDGNPVFIYFHGNTKNRYNTLGYHVVVPDYRGFGDSTGEPTEDGLTTDALYIYNWVKARSGSSLVVIWGHSLGTACVQMIFHIFSKNTPGKVITFPWKLEGGGHRPSTRKITYIKKMKSPILFLHSEDDHLARIENVEEVILVIAQNKDRVKLVKFDGSKGYLHNGLYRDAKLPGVIKDFVASL
uniref:AB hydrolase-1 domain-containing protein n=1 Tax=Periophthalmus magnuspinnatus TaxID=409849 RepID=A0A3B3ZUL8_9GOBI